MDKGQKKKRSGKRIALIVLCVVLALVLVAGIGVTVVLNWAFGAMRKPDNTPMSSEDIHQDIIKNTDPVNPDFTGPELHPDNVWTTGPEQTTPAQTTLPQNEKDVINIMLIGQDRRPGEGRCRSDAMILCSICLEDKTLVMTSFQRDTYVQFPGDYSDNKLNAAYQWGGMPLLDQTLEMNFGIHIDGNIEVDFNRFVQIVDLLGGVDISLTQAEADWLSLGGNSVAPGTQHLDGETALAYARIRKLDNDFGRTNRQRKVIISLLNSCKGSGVNTLTNLVKEILPMIATDMSEKEIMNLAMDIIPILKDLEITSQSIPAKGTYTEARVKGMYVLIPDLEANRALLHETIYEE